MGMKCGTTTLIFFTSTGGAGNFAHKFNRDLAGTGSRPSLQRHFFPESTTTRYFFLLAPSIK